MRITQKSAIYLQTFLVFTAKLDLLHDPPCYHAVGRKSKPFHLACANELTESRKYSRYGSYAGGSLSLFIVVVSLNSRHRTELQLVSFNQKNYNHNAHNMNTVQYYGLCIAYTNCGERHNTLIICFSFIFSFLFQRRSYVRF